VIERVQSNHRIECRGRKFEPCHIGLHETCAGQDLASTSELLEGNVDAGQRDLVMVRPSVATSTTEVQHVCAARQALHEILQVVNGGLVDGSIGNPTSIANGYEVCLLTREWAKVGGKSKHVEGQLGDEGLVDLFGAVGVVLFRQKKEKQWSPEVIGGARVVEAEDVRPGPDARCRVLDIWKMRAHEWRDGVCVERGTQLESWYEPPVRSHVVHGFSASIKYA
jgi:hypothetical protein